MPEEQYDEHRPSLEDKMAEEIDQAMTLADDLDFAPQIRGWENEA